MSNVSEEFQARIVYAIPDMRRVSVERDLVYKTVDATALRFDVYYPPAAEKAHSYSTVILMHGEAPPEMLANAKDWGQFVSWAELLAAQGFVAVTFNRRSAEWFTKLPEAASDITDLLSYLQQYASALAIDWQRIGVWVCSGGTLAASAALRHYHGLHLRALAAYYPRMSLHTIRDDLTTMPESTLDAYDTRHLLPRMPTHDRPALFIARAGQDDRPGLNAALDQFLVQALETNVALTLITHPEGGHFFDVAADNERSREIIRQTVAFFQQHLTQSATT
jgi:acetyl esterase/lipase